jgi:hypothetical protein
MVRRMSDGGEKTTAKAAQDRVLDARAASIARTRAEREALESNASDAEVVALSEKQLTARFGAEHVAFMCEVVTAAPERTRALLLSPSERDDARAVVVGYCRALLREQGAELPDPIAPVADGAKPAYPEVDLALYDRTRALLDTHAQRKAKRAADRSWLTGAGIFGAVLALCALFVWRCG